MARYLTPRQKEILDFIREFMTEEQLTQLQRSKPVGVAASRGS